MISMRNVVEILSLTPRSGYQNPSQEDFVCPFCGKSTDRKAYKLSVNFDREVWRCLRCNAQGGKMDLYSRVVYGEPYERGTERAKQIRAEIQNKVSPKKIKQIIPTRPAPVQVASDEKLNNVYEAMRQLQLFKLTETHKKSLEKRGLKDTCEYRTMPDAKTVQFPDAVTELFEAEKMEETIINLPMKLSKSTVLLGLLICKELTAVGVNDFYGVPGFFKVGSTWCCYNTSGIMIPTRNPKGQIVCYQIRKDSGTTRYITLSAKKLPCTVQDGISRCHVVTNAPKTDMQNVDILLTEGALKANVIAALSRQKVLVVAIQGINNTKPLGAVMEWLKEQGVTTIYNALDMDRLTNRNVREGSTEIGRMIRKAGLSVQAMVWDEESARAKAASLYKRAKEANVVLPQMGNANIYCFTAVLAQTLEKIGPLKEEEEKWASRSKGYDDWLYYLRNISQNSTP